MSEPALIHDPKMAHVDIRYCSALTRAGIKSWSAVVNLAQESPMTLRKVAGLGPRGLDQLRAALAGAKVEHSLHTKR